MSLGRADLLTALPDPFAAAARRADATIPHSTQLAHTILSALADASYLQNNQHAIYTTRL